MLDFSLVREHQISLQELAGDLTRTELSQLTNEMVDTVLGLMVECVDADVVFEPHDPEAYDPVAATAAELYMPWTLGHVIVHITASAEEAAFLAVELARGVPNHGRSRYEVPWQTMQTLSQCRQRLEESRRMRLSSLEMWPASPHLDLTYRPYDTSEPMNAVTRFIAGLMHDDSHLAQIAEIVRQAKAARR